MTAGQHIFLANARRTLHDIGMQHLDLSHGAAVEAVRWCLVVRGRPTHHRQELLERECPALLTYLETLARSDDSVAWRTLEERIRTHAEVLTHSAIHPCRRPWLSAIWHVLPELAAIGRTILDRQAPKDDALPAVAPASVASDEGIEDGKGSGGASGTAGMSLRSQPAPSSRLNLPVRAVQLTEPEKRALNFVDIETVGCEATTTAPGAETEHGIIGLSSGAPK